MASIVLVSEAAQLAHIPVRTLAHLDCGLILKLPARKQVISSSSRLPTFSRRRAWHLNSLSGN